jgi:O-acetylhomoserine (thiol)-lyase
MALRAQRTGENALAVATFLASDSKVSAVNYPGLASSSAHEAATRQFNGFYGALLTFTLPTKEACFRCVDALTLIRRATNLNDNKTLAIHPASTIYSEFPPDVRATLGVGEGLIRLSVGIEDLEDLLHDLRQAIDAA